MMRIRDVQPDGGDFDAIASITNYYILNTVIHFGSEPQTAAELRDAWRKNPAIYPFLVMVDEADRPIAYAKAGRWRDRAAYAKTAEVGIYVDRAHQGRGHGKRLYAELIARCRAAGFHSLIGGITLPNASSTALHDALGFREVGVFHECGHKMGAWRDVAFYELLLEDRAADTEQAIPRKSR